jgi:hypothetical protein
VEGDANFTNLNTDKLQNLSEDTTPQLGGNLDVNTHSIVSASNGDITIAPNGTGKIVLDGLNWPTADGTNGQVLSTNGTGQLSFVASSSFAPASPGEIGASTPADASFLHLNVKSSGGTVKELRLHDDNNSNYTGFRAPSEVGTNKIYTLPITDGTNGQMLTTDGTGGLSWTTGGGAFAPATPGEIGASTPDIGNFTDLKVKSASSTVKELQLYDQDNSNYVGFKSPTSVTTNKIYVLPATDGSATHVLQTDGSGNLSWAAASSFAPASPGEIGASTPADASFLNLNVKSASNIVKELRLHDEDNSNYVGFKSPTNVGSNRIYTLPSTDGTNGHFLKTDGTGGLSWSAAGGGGNLDDLTDVTITTPTNTQVLSYNNGIWSNSTPSTFAQASPGEIGASVPDVGNFTDLKVKSASSTVKELQLHDQDNSNYVGFKAPSTVSTNKVWVLPNADGTNGQVLSTNGSATLSWATAGGSRSVAILRDTFANNSYSLVDGTNTLEASWTEVSDTDSLISTSTHSFTLVAGTYYFQFRSPSLYGRADAIGAALVPMFRLKNTTDTTIMAGSPDNMRYYVTSTTADTLVGPVSFNTYFTIAGTKTFQIEYEQANNTNAKWANGEGSWTQRSQWWIFITKF